MSLKPNPWNFWRDKCVILLIYILRFLDAINNNTFVTYKTVNGSLRETDELWQETSKVHLSTWQILFITWYYVEHTRRHISAISDRLWQRMFLLGGKFCWGWRNLQNHKVCTKMIGTTLSKISRHLHFPYGYSLNSG